MRGFASMKMPILWRYLLGSYFRVFALSLSGFISVLLVLRFQEIARFACSGASLSHIALFSLLQIFHILPLAIPISCLISSLVLLQQMSHSQELTAWRTSGLSLRPILQPVLLASLFLSLANLTISGEVLPRTRVMSKQLVYHAISDNPLVLFQKEGVVKMKNAHIAIEEMPSQKLAKGVLFATKNASSKRLTMMFADELEVKGRLLRGKNVAFISSIDPKKEEGFDHLVIENQRRMDTKATSLSQFIKNNEWGVTHEQQTLKELLARGWWKHKKSGEFPISGLTAFEISRRFSIALATFTFTLIGVSFGIHLGRRSSYRGLSCAIALATFYIICFIAAKSLHRSSLLSSCILLLPHPIIWGACLAPLRRISQGVETV